MIARKVFHGTWVVGSENQIIPIGKTWFDTGVLVHEYTWGFACQRHGTPNNTTKKPCEHIRLVKAS